MLQQWVPLMFIICYTWSLFSKSIWIRLPRAAKATSISKTANWVEILIWKQADFKKPLWASVSSFVKLGIILIRLLSGENYTVLSSTCHLTCIYVFVHGQSFQRLQDNLAPLYAVFSLVHILGCGYHCFAVLIILPPSIVFKTWALPFKSVIHFKVFFCVSVKDQYWVFHVNNRYSNVID